MTRPRPRTPVASTGSAWLSDPALGRMFARYRVALCGPTLLMVGLSWPLWVDAPDFPRVPFVGGLPVLPPWISGVVLGGMMATLALAAFGLRWRGIIAASLTLLGFAILRDQDRFQPWAYQYGVIGLAMVGLTRARALRMARWYVFGLYIYSGLSKFDASFCRELGPTFLSAALGPFGIEPRAWPESSRVAACLAMPTFEIAVAWLLWSPKTRRVGLVGAVAQHLTLVGLLGPWGLGHSPIVLAWNLALIAQDVILFGQEIPVDCEVEPRPGPFVRRAFWLAMILPGGERLGLCDAWPGHALYASHVERSDVFVHEDDLGRYPESIRRHLGPGGVTPWRRLDLTAWSRSARGTPMYPSGRVGNAVAEYLESRFAGPQPVRLVQWGRARPWDVPRDRDESVGLKAIRHRGDEFLLNAHPAGDRGP